MDGPSFGEIVAVASPQYLHHQREAYPMRWIKPLLLVMCAAVSFGAWARPSTIHGFDRHVYKVVDGEELALHVSKPVGWKASDRRPALVFFHGGGWIGGKANAFARQAEYFSSRGLVTVLVTYRLLDRESKTAPDKPIQDAKSAMRWVRAHAGTLGVDPDRVGSFGGSAGGHLAAFVGMVEGMDDPADDPKVSAKANAMILFNPVFDNGPSGWQHGRVGERYGEYSPFHNISKDDPPAILLVGDKDHLVPAATACQFEGGMKAAGGQATVRIFAGAGHSFFRYQGGTNPAYFETLREADAFLVSLGWLTGPPTLQFPTALVRRSTVRTCAK
jgi:acetyl esterase